MPADVFNPAQLAQEAVGPFGAVFVLVVFLAIAIYAVRELSKLYRAAQDNYIATLKQGTEDRLADAAARLEDMRQQRDWNKDLATRATDASVAAARAAAVQGDQMTRALDLLEGQLNGGPKRRVRP